MQLNLIGTLITSFIITFFTIPSIIRIANEKRLFDEPDERKKHDGVVPTLGGMGIFAGLIISLCFWIRPEDFFQMKYVITSVSIMFFTGIKDDVVNLVAWKKLVAQLVAAFVLVYFGDIRITSLYGLFNVYDIHYLFSIALSVTVVVMLTNSFNLIDGVNMLAGSIGVLTSTFFGIWFIISGYNSMGVLSLAAIGSYLAFLWYNRTPAKIFMGDTGALLLGLVSSVLAIKFIEINKIEAGPYQITSVPAVTISILIFPIFDTLRVFTKRILNGTSPFHADRGHIHHLFLDIGFSHSKTTFTIIVFNILFIVAALLLQNINGELLLFISLLIIFILTLLLEKKVRNISLLVNVKK